MELNVTIEVDEKMIANALIEDVDVNEFDSYDDYLDECYNVFNDNYEDYITELDSVTIMGIDLDDVMDCIEEYLEKNYETNKK